MILSYSRLSVSSQYAIHNAFERLANSGLKLATLKRINQGSDDPAGLIAAEKISNELAAVEAAAQSADRTRAFANIADSALSGAGDLLNDIQSHLVSAANGLLSPEEWEATQYQIDASLDALGRLGQTSFAGEQLFGRTVQFLSGTQPTDVTTLDLPAVDDSLGGPTGTLSDLRSGGSASIASGNLETASDILNEARSQILSARAQIGSFEKYVVDSTQHVLQDMQVNLSSALSSVRDTDVAAESSNFVRDQILAQASVMTASLLRHNRRATVSLLANRFDRSE